MAKDGKWVPIYTTTGEGKSKIDFKFVVNYEDKDEDEHPV